MKKLSDMTWAHRHSTCLFSITVDNTVVTRALLTVGGGRGDLDLDLTTDEILADGMVYRDKKDQLEVAIGDGMEFTIHGQYWIYDEVCISLLLLASCFIKKKSHSYKLWLYDSTNFINTLPSCYVSCSLILKNYPQGKLSTNVYKQKPSVLI